jgi:hypothetical protein
MTLAALACGRAQSTAVPTTAPTAISTTARPPTVVIGPTPTPEPPPYYPGGDSTIPSNTHPCTDTHANRNSHRDAGTHACSYSHSGPCGDCVTHRHTRAHAQSNPNLHASRHNRTLLRR